MIIIKKMFADKILRFNEYMNQLLLVLYMVPGLGGFLSVKIREENNRRLKLVFGVIAQLGVFVLEFARKLLYVAVFMYLPYMIIGNMCPLILSNRTGTIVFFFFILSTVCGSLANTTLMAMGNRDYMIVRIMLVSPYLNFLGKLAYKVFMDIIYFTLILRIMGLPWIGCVSLSLLTAAARPVGEMIAILTYEHCKLIYNRRGIFNGFIMASAVLFSYGMPMYARHIGEGWLVFMNPLVAAAMLVVGLAATVYLWWYKDYRKIMHEAIYIKHEE